MEIIKFKEGDTLENPTPLEAEIIHSALEKKGYHMYKSTEDRLEYGDFKTKKPWGFVVDDGVLKWMLIGTSNIKEKHDFTWWHDALSDSNKDNLVLPKTYWLLRNSNSIADITEVHRLMQLAGARMGSDHNNRDNFDYNFYFDEATRKYYACNIGPDNDTKVNIIKSAEWFKSFIKNNFKDPQRYVIDNSESSKKTFLDQQITQL